MERSGPTAMGRRRGQALAARRPTGGKATGLSRRRLVALALLVAGAASLLALRAALNLRPAHDGLERPRGGRRGIDGSRSTDASRLHSYR